MKDNIPSGLKWELKSHNHQIADTGDYDGCYELTNGQVSIFTKYDDDEGLQKIVDAFNDSDCTDFYLDDSHLWQIKGLEYQLAELREKLQLPSSTSVQVEEIEYFLYDVASNYDCDSDAHKYGSRCRACEAKKLLQSNFQNSKYLQ